MTGTHCRGRPPQLTADHRIRIVEDARRAIQHFGKEGVLDWIGFLRMITRKPWRDLLPGAAQQKIPLLALKLSKVGMPIGRRYKASVAEHCH